MVAPKQKQRQPPRSSWMRLRAALCHACFAVPWLALVLLAHHHQVLIPSVCAQDVFVVLPDPDPDHDSVPYPDPYPDPFLPALPPLEFPLDPLPSSDSAVGEKSKDKSLALEAETNRNESLVLEGESDRTNSLALKAETNHRDKSLALTETNQDKSLALEVMWNGRVVARNVRTGEVQWSFSSGPPLSSNGMDQSNMVEDGSNMGNKVLDNVDNDKYLFCGDDWKLHPFEKRYGTEFLPVSPHVLVGNTPAILDDIVVLGSTTTTAFLVDADSGSMIQRFDLHKDLSDNITDEATKLWSRNDKWKDANILFIFRKDYRLQSIGAISGELLWNVSVGEVSLHYAQYDGVLRLLGAPGNTPGDIIWRNPKTDTGADSNRIPNGVISGSWRIPISGSEKTLPAQQDRLLLPAPEPKAIVTSSDWQNLETLTLPSSIHSMHNSDIISLGATQRKKAENSKILTVYSSTWFGRFTLGSLALFVLGCIFAISSRFKKASQQDKKETLGKKKKVRKTPGHNTKAVSKVEGTITESSPKQEKSIVGEDKTLGAILPVNKLREKTYEDYGEGRRVGNLFIKNTIIGYGSHGTIVYEGYLEKRHVAVKRLLAEFYEKAEKEIANLIASDEHPNIVRCYAMELDVNFVYVALERCSFSLNDIINFHRTRLSKTANDDTNFQQSIEEDNGQLFLKVCDAEYPELWDELGYPLPILIQFMRDIVAGLAHLHDLGIVHRDLKPQNVLISSGRILQAKLSDMGISKRLADNASSFQTHATGLGSSGWQAPEQLLQERQTRAVDLFSLGCVLFFCLSAGDHPFGSCFERDTNILKGKPDLFLVEHIPEAQHLLSCLLENDPLKRIAAKFVLAHPMFWSLEKCLSFLRDASDRVELEDREEHSYLLQDLEARASIALGGHWDEKLDNLFLENLGRYRRYNYGSVRDLLRVIRNKSNHYRELPQDVQDLVGTLPEGFTRYFKNKFPHLLLEVYKVLLKHCRWESLFQPYFTECCK